MNEKTKLCKLKKLPSQCCGVLRQGADHVITGHGFLYIDGRVIAITEIDGGEYIPTEQLEKPNVDK